MGLDKFKDAFAAMPDSAGGEDISDFLAGVAVSYMPPQEAVTVLLGAVATVLDYAKDVQEKAEAGESTCDCPNCKAARDAVKRH